MNLNTKKNIIIITEGGKKPVKNDWASWKQNIGPVAIIGADISAYILKLFDDSENLLIAAPNEQVINVIIKPKNLPWIIVASTNKLELGDEIPKFCLELLNV